MAETTKKADYWDELVPYTAFKDNDKYKDDLVFTVAGKLWQIKRGVEVMIPRYVYEVIMNSDKQAQKAANYVEEQTRAYKMASKNFE